MRYFTLIFIGCASLWLMASIAGCMASGGGTDKFPTPDPITVALPYVEAVHLPAEIRAGQPFSITVDLSSVMDPDALRYPAWPANQNHWTARDPVVEDGQTVYKYYAEFWPYRDLTQASATAPVQSSVTYTFDALPAGAHKLIYYSAPTQEQGGMGVRFDKLTHNQLDSIPSSSKTMEFTVLP
jgi:hypothetical protein